MNEWPLIFFTILTQLAAGAFVTLWFLDMKGRKIDQHDGRMATASVAIILAAGLGLSLLHLGIPFMAFRALTNLGSSWLSREVLLFSLLLALIIIFYFQWDEGKEGSRRVIGVAAAVVAVLAVIASAMIYVLPARPAWNNLSPVVFFLLTTVLLGPLYMGTFFSLKGKDWYSLPLISVVVIGFYALSFFLYLSVLLSGSGPEALTGQKIMQSAAFWGRVVLSWILPLTILVPATLGRRLDSRVISLIFLLVLLGEIMGRELFYSSVVALQVGGW